MSGKIGVRELWPTMTLQFLAQNRRHASRAAPPEAFACPMCGEGQEACRCGEGHWHPDNAAWDATDAAHPAWWRGQEHGVRSACRRMAQVLDGQDDGGGVISGRELEALRRRLLALVR